MGRGKTQLTKLEDDDSISKSFKRRQTCLVKKAYEMGTLTGIDVALIFFSKEGELTPFSMNARSITDVIAKFINLPEEKRGMRIENSGYLLEILEKIKFDDAAALRQQTAGSCSSSNSNNGKTKIEELQTVLHAVEFKRQELLQRLRYFFPDRSNAPITSTFEESRKKTILTALAQVKERKIKLIQQATAAACQQECTTTSLRQQYYPDPPQQGYHATAPLSQQHYTIAPPLQIYYVTPPLQQECTTATHHQQYSNTALPQQYCTPNSSWQCTLPPLQQQYSQGAPRYYNTIADPQQYYNTTAPSHQEYCTSSTPQQCINIPPLQQQHPVSAPPQDDYHVPAPLQQEHNSVPLQQEWTTSSIVNEPMAPFPYFEQQSTDVYQNNPSTVHQRVLDDSDVGTVPRETVADDTELSDSNLPLNMTEALTTLSSAWGSII